MTIPFQPFDEGDRPDLDDVDESDRNDDLGDDGADELDGDDLLAIDVAQESDDFDQFDVDDEFYEFDGDNKRGTAQGAPNAAASDVDPTSGSDELDDDAFVVATPAEPGTTAPPVEPEAAELKNTRRPVAHGDETALGTAATLSKAEAANRSKPSTETPKPKKARRRGGSRPILGLAAVILAALALAVVPLLGSAFKQTPRDRFGISYGGGPIEGVHFQKIVEPGSGLFFNGFFDSLFLYPADQLNYILSSTPGADGETTDDAVTAPSSDRVAVSYQVAVYFKLNTDELRSFHEDLGLRYRAYTDAGWDDLLADTLRQQIEASLQEQTRRHTVSDLYSNAELLVTVQQEIQVTLSQRLEATLGGRYFCSPTFVPGGECGDPSFVIKRTDIPKAVADAFESNRTSDVMIATKENEVRQREQEARGIEALSDALRESGPAYVLLKAIESGQINFWVLPDDGGVNLTAPEAPTAPAGE